MSIKIILQQFYNNSIILEPPRDFSSSQWIKSKKKYIGSPATSQQSNVYIANELFYYLRLGTNFSNLRTFSKSIGTPGTRYRPLLFWVGVLKALYPNLRL